MKLRSFFPVMTSTALEFAPNRLSLNNTFSGRLVVRGKCLIVYPKVSIYPTISLDASAYIYFRS